MGRQPKHHDSDLSSVRTNTHGPWWRSILRHTDLAKPHAPIRRVSSPSSLVVGQLNYSSIHTRHWDQIQCLLFLVGASAPAHPRPPIHAQNGSFVSLNRKLDGDKRCDGNFFSFDLQFGFERSRDTIAAKVFEVRSDFDRVVGSFPRLCGFERPNHFAI